MRLSVQLGIAHRKSEYVLEPSPDNWHVQIAPIQQVRKQGLGVELLINYESPGPQVMLSNMEKEKQGASLDAFNKTLGDITGQYKAYGLQWAPPMTQSYDSIDLKTGPWIARQLKRIALVS